MKKLTWIALLLVFAAGVAGCAQQTATDDSDAVRNDVSLPPATDYSADIQYDYSQQAMDYLTIIGTQYTRRGGEDGGSNQDHDACADWIVEELRQAGYRNEEILIDEFETGSYNGKNIVVTIEGKDPSKQIIVGAHYDGTGTGDNGSGIALLLANVCGLREVMPDVTVKCVFFDGEERGLWGSEHYAACMEQNEIDSTLFMLNIDSVAFGDYCHVYGGVTVGSSVESTEGYELAMERAGQLGFTTYRTEDLDGYYREHGTGPVAAENALYTNPWTEENPTPYGYAEFISPSTGPWSDHQPFCERDIPYIYFEATNWYVGDYDGYIDTDRADAGKNGAFMNTEYDTLSELEMNFPGRAIAHYRVYSPLLASLMIHPER